MEIFHSGGKAIRSDHIAPRTSARKLPAVILLHGAGGNIGFWLDRIAPFISLAGVAVFAPHYFERTGTTRADPATILDGHHFPLWLETIADAVTHVAQRPEIDPTRIALLGVSLGAFLSVALAAQAPTPHTRALKAVVEISGGLPGPFATALTPRFPPTLVIHGEADTVVPVAEAHRLDRALTAVNVSHQSRLFPGEGHWFSSSAQAAILQNVALFLAQHLTAPAPAGALR